MIVAGEDLRLLAREGTLPNIADLQANNDGTSIAEFSASSRVNRGSAPLAACLRILPTSFDGASVVFFNVSLSAAAHQRGLRVMSSWEQVGTVFNQPTRGPAGNDRAALQQATQNAGPWQVVPVANPVTASQFNFAAVNGLVCVAAVDDDVDSRAILKDSTGMPMGPQSSAALMDALTIAAAPCSAGSFNSAPCDSRFDALAASGFKRSVQVVVEEDDVAGVATFVYNSSVAPAAFLAAPAPAPTLHEDASGTTTIAVGVKLLSRPMQPVTVAVTSAIRTCRLVDGSPTASLRLCGEDNDCDGISDGSENTVNGVCSSGFADVVAVEPASFVVTPANWSMSVTEATQSVDQRPASPSDFLYAPDAIFFVTVRTDSIDNAGPFASPAGTIRTALGAAVLEAADMHYSPPVLASGPAQQQRGALAAGSAIATAWPTGFVADAVAVTVVDDDTTTVVVSSTSASSVAEGEAVTYTVVLTSQPRGAVVVAVDHTTVLAGTVDVSASDSVRVIVQPEQLTFQPSDWSTPQTVTARMVSNFVDEGAASLSIKVAHAVESSTMDRFYSLLQTGDSGAPADAAFAVANDDVAGLVLSIGGVASGHDVTYGQAVPVILTISSQPLSQSLSVEVAAHTASDDVEGLGPARLLFTGAESELQAAFGSEGVAELSSLREGLDSVATAVIERDEWTQSVVVGFVAPAQAADGLRLTATVSALTGVDAQYDGIVRTMNVSLSQSVVSGAATGALLYTASGIVPSVEETTGSASTPVAEVLVNVAAIPSGCMSGALATTLADTEVSIFMADGHCRCDGVDRFDLPCSTGSSGSGHSMVFGSCGGCSSTASAAKEQCVAGKQLKLEEGGLVSSSAALSGNSAGAATLDLTAAVSGVGTIRVSAVDDTDAEGKIHMAGLSLIVVTGSSCGALGQAFTAGAVGSIAVRIADNDLAGLQTAVVSAAATEGGQGASYTVRLSAEPRSAVTVVPVASFTASGAPLPAGQLSLRNASGAAIASVTLDASNWNTGVTVTVVIGDDDIDMGASFGVTVAHVLESADPRFTGDALAQTDVAITVADNDQAAVTMQLLDGASAPVTSLELTEDSATSTGFIRVALATVPSVPQASITVRLTASADIFVRTVSGATSVFPTISVTFIPGQRSIDVAIANPSNNVDEPDVPSVQVSLTLGGLGVVVRAPEYASLANVELSQTLSLVDDDTFALGSTVDDSPAYTSAFGAEVSEGASDATGVALLYVKMQAAPPAGQSVLVRPSSVNERLTVLTGADATAAGASQYGAAFFHEGNWNAPQVLAFAAVDDFVALRRGTSEFSSSDPAGTFEMVRVQLSVDPEFSTAESYIGAPAGTVAAIVKRNDDDRNAVVMLGLDGSPLPAADSESPVAASLTEGTFDSATEVLVALSSRPMGDQGVTVSLSALSPRVVAQPSTVTLTADNWQEGEFVRIEVVDDSLAQPAKDTVIVAAAASSGDGFEGYSEASTTVAVYDDDSAVPMIGGAMPGQVLSAPLQEGVSTTLSLSLGADFPATSPIFAVVSAASVDGGVDASVSPATSFLTFTASGSAGAKDIVVTTGDDQVAGDGAARICVFVFASDAAAYAASTEQQCFTAIVRDDSDVAGLDAIAVEGTFANATAAVAGNVLAGGMLTATETLPGLLSVRLTSMPRGVVSMSLAVRSATESVVGGDPVAIAESGIAVSPDSLTFTPDNWNLPVYVEVTSTSDGVVGAVRAAQIAASVAAPRDPEYDSLPELSASLRVSDIDGQESSAPVVRAVSGQAATLVNATSGMVTVVAAEGSSVVVGVRLAARPMVGVEVVLTASNTETDTVSHSLPAAGLVFGRDSWQTEQTFTVTVANDDVARDYVAAIVATATARGVGSGANMDVSGLWATSQTAVDLAVENDDDAEIVISSLAAPAVSVPVGGSLELSIVAGSKPTGDVTVALAKGADAGCAAVSISPATVTFTTTDGPAAAAKVVTVTPSGTTAATCGITALVTASAASEFAVGSAARLGSTAGPSTSATGITVSVISSGLTTSASTIRLTEGGAAGSYTVGLVSSDVGGSVALTATPSSGVGLASPYANLVLTGDATFALSSAALTRAVQFAAANDDRAFALRVVTVSHAFTPEGAAASTMEVTVLVEDFEDAPGVFVTAADSASSVVVDELASGATASLSVRLGSMPGAAVTVSLVELVGAQEATGADAALSFSPASVVIQPADWNTAVSVTVSGAGSDAALGDRARTIAVRTTSTDDSYALDGVASTTPRAATTQLADGSIIRNVRSLPRIAATVRDTDVAAVLFAAAAPAPMPLKESAAASASAPGHSAVLGSVTLSAKPRGNVVVDVAGDASVTASPAKLTFTAANWNMPQNVSAVVKDDKFAQGTHTGRLSMSVNAQQTADRGFLASLTLPSPSIAVEDDDMPSVALVSATGSAQQIAEGASEPASFSVSIGAAPFVIGSAGSGAGSVTLQLEVSSGYCASVADGVLAGGEADAQAAFRLAADFTSACFDATDCASATGATTQCVAGLLPHPTIAVRSRDGLSSVPGSTITFSEADGVAGVSRVVTVSVADDSVAVGGVFAFRLRAVVDALQSNDAGYQALVTGSDAEAAFSATDNDVIGLVSRIANSEAAPGTPMMLAEAEFGESDAEGAFFVELSSQPRAAVLCSVAAPADQLTVFPDVLAFDERSWEDVMLIEVSAVDDEIAEARPHAANVTLSCESADPAYDGLTAALRVSIMDNDEAGVSVEREEPVSVGTGSAEQSVFIRAVDPASDVWTTEACIAVCQNSINACPRDVCNVFSYPKASAPFLVAVEGGATDAVAISLTSEPTAPVTVRVPSVMQVITGTVVADACVAGPAGSGQSGVSQAQLESSGPNAVTGGDGTFIAELTFTAENWFEPQVVIVGARDDRLDEAGDEHRVSAQLAIVSNDAMYGSLATVPSLAVSIREDAFTAPPVLSSAKFDNELTSLTLTFDRDTNAGGSAGGAFACSELLSPMAASGSSASQCNVPAIAARRSAVATLFGAGSSCQWQSRRQLQVRFGRAPTVLPGHSIALVPGKVKTSSAARLSSAGVVNVTAAANGILPVADIGPGSRTIGRCDKLTVSVREAGGGNRPLACQWSIVSVVNTATRQTSTAAAHAAGLKTVLDARNAGDSAVSCATIALANASAITDGYTVTLKVTVTNFNGGSATTQSAIVKQGIAAPSLVAPSSVSVLRSAEQFIDVRAFAPRCPGEAELSAEARAMRFFFFDASASPMATDVPSQLLGGGSLFTSFDASADAATQSGGRLVAPPGASARQFDTSPLPFIVVPGKALTPGLKYTVRVFAQLISNPAAVASADIEVVPQLDALRSSIAGGSFKQAPVDAAFTLDASSSSDPSALSGVAATFSWSCQPDAAANSAAGLAAVADCGSAGATVGATTTSSVTLPALSLSAGYTYRFTVTYTKGSRSSVSTQTVQAVSGAGPEVLVLEPETIDFAGILGGQLSVVSAQDSVFLDAVVNSLDEDSLELQWTQEGGPPLPAGAFTDPDMADELFASSPLSSTLIVRGDTLLPSSTYEFCVTATDATGSRKACTSFMTAPEPAGGYVEVEAADASAASAFSPFVVSTGGWGASNIESFTFYILSRATAPADVAASWLSEDETSAFGQAIESLKGASVFAEVPASTSSLTTQVMPAGDVVIIVEVETSFFTRGYAWTSLTVGAYTGTQADLLSSMQNLAGDGNYKQTLGGANAVSSATGGASGASRRVLAQLTEGMSSPALRASSRRSLRAAGRVLETTQSVAASIRALLDRALQQGQSATLSSDLTSLAADVTRALDLASSQQQVSVMSPTDARVYLTRVNTTLSIFASTTSANAPAVTVLDAMARASARLVAAVPAAQADYRVALEALYRGYLWHLSDTATAKPVGALSFTSSFATRARASAVGAAKNILQLGNVTRVAGAVDRFGAAITSSIVGRLSVTGSARLASLSTGAIVDAAGSQAIGALVTGVDTAHPMFANASAWATADARFSGLPAAGTSSEAQDADAARRLSIAGQVTLPASAALPAVAGRASGLAFSSLLVDRLDRMVEPLGALVLASGSSAAVATAAISGGDANADTAANKTRFAAVYESDVPVACASLATMARGTASFTLAGSASATISSSVVSAQRTAALFVSNATAAAAGRLSSGAALSASTTAAVSAGSVTVAGAFASTSSATARAGAATPFLAALGQPLVPASGSSMCRVESFLRTVRPGQAMSVALDTAAGLRLRSATNAASAAVVVAPAQPALLEGAQVAEADSAALSGVVAAAATSARVGLELTAQPRGAVTLTLASNTGNGLCVGSTSGLLEFSAALVGVDAAMAAAADAGQSLPAAVPEALRGKRAVDAAASVAGVAAASPVTYWPQAYPCSTNADCGEGYVCDAGIGMSSTRFVNRATGSDVDAGSSIVVGGASGAAFTGSNGVGVAMTAAQDSVAELMLAPPTLSAAIEARLNAASATRAGLTAALRRVLGATVGAEIVDSIAVAAANPTLATASDEALKLAFSTPTNKTRISLAAKAVAARLSVGASSVALNAALKAAQDAPVASNSQSRRRIALVPVSVRAASADDLRYDATGRCAVASTDGKSCQRTLPKAGRGSWSFGMLAVDDDAIRVSITPTAGAEGAFNSSMARVNGIKEGTASLSFRVEVRNRVRMPRGTIRVQLAALPYVNDASASPLSCANAVADFGSEDTAASKTVTCTVVDDNVARGARVPARVTATISLPSITSAADHTAALTALVPPPLAADHAGVAPTYSAATPWVRTMTAFVEDNDASGLKLFAVTPTPATSQRTGLAAGITKEAALSTSTGSLSFSVGLLSRPSAPVTLRVRLTSGMAADSNAVSASAKAALSAVVNVTVQPAQFATGGVVRINAGTLMAGQTEAVFAATVEAVSTDAAYNGLVLAGPVLVSITDPAAAALQVTAQSTSVSEGFTATVATVRLSVSPGSATVVVRPAVLLPAWARNNSAAAALFIPTSPAPLSVATAELVFTSANWNVAQNVRVTAANVDSPLPFPEQPFAVSLPITVSSTAGPFNANGTVYYANALPVSFSQSETAAITYTDVTARFAAGATGAEAGSALTIATGQPAPALTLTEDNSYSGAAFDRIASVFGAAVAQGIGAASFRVIEASVASKPAAAFTLRLGAASPATTLLSSGAAELFAKEAALPSDVTVTGTAGAAFRFKPTNFASAKPLFLVRAANRVDHAAADLSGSLRFSVDASSASDDLAFRNAATVGTVSVSVTDDDVAGVTVTRTGRTEAVGSSSAASANFSIVLDSQPQAPVTVGLVFTGLPAECASAACTSVAAIGSTASSVVAADGSLAAVFSAASWSTASTVQVTLTPNGQALMADRGLTTFSARFVVSAAGDASYSALRTSTLATGVSTTALDVAALEAVSLAVTSVRDLERNGGRDGAIRVALPSGIAIGKIVAVDVDIDVTGTVGSVSRPAGGFGLRVAGGAATVAGRPAMSAAATAGKLYSVVAPVGDGSTRARYTLVMGGAAESVVLEVFAVDTSASVEDVVSGLRVNASVSATLTTSSRYSSAATAKATSVTNVAASLSVVAPSPSPTPSVTPTPSTTPSTTPSAIPTPSGTPTPSTTPTAFPSATPSPSTGAVVRKVSASLSFGSSLSASQLRANATLLGELRKGLAAAITARLSSASSGRMLQATGVEASSIEIRNVTQSGASTVKVDFAVLVGDSSAASSVSDPAAITSALNAAANDGSLAAQLTAQPGLSGVVTGGVVVSNVQVESSGAPSATPSPTGGKISQQDFTAAYVVAGVVGGLLAVGILFFAVRRCFFRPTRVTTNEPEATTSDDPAARVAVWS
ncbi:hypothetical protein FNF31_07504 [Cafeteria roenbergensis]|uniref:PKD/REJ-like domain-containing protein n=2 Tax=Cafeteria roenbergensis TaxID=33653 RepID=A0A5A8C7Y7_CAFRO|nr:hypothetical protein FNF31_07504 [Cafeteria roenbergensis]